MCLVALLVTHLVGTLHGVALPTGATDAAAVPAVEPSAVPGVVEAAAVEEIQLVVEASEDVEEQAEQSVGVAGVEEACRGGEHSMRFMAHLCECVGEGRRCYALRVGLKRQAAEVSEGHSGVPGVLLIRLEQRGQRFGVEAQVHGVVPVLEGQAFFEVCVVLCLLNLLADQDIHVATVAVVAQLAVLLSVGGGDLVAAAVEESAESVAQIDVVVPPAAGAAFAALLRQPVEGVAQCGQRGEEDLGAHGAVGRQLCNVSDGDGLCALGSYGLGEGLIFDQGSGERLPGVS
ncbi:zinc finger RNA-binding protein 2, putative [Babesia ovata]|uniref:Zinc finger RNA-binding protein 2, putative n=1 Tax=Babesia ovata TaxID=189622 RepID=A0A2H6KIM7_9APIC|nr:zinc finger RNA-binding protein 2, putative [Babesia ovata]GBE62843.1 zinc finger RNA-binding protein 2, putative [Babesia ovata]